MACRVNGYFFFSSSPISGKRGRDLEKAGAAIAASVSHGFHDLDAVIDAFELAGMYRPAHAAQDTAPIRRQSNSESS
jgi:hypothetical protein